MRSTIASCLATLLLLASCTKDKAFGPATSSAGAGSGGGQSSAGGTSSSGGTTASGGSVVYTTFGGGDNGALFGLDAVPFDPSALGGSGGSGGGSGGSTDVGPPGDGNVATSTIRGSANATAVFTQSGTDVTVVITFTSCPDGDLVVNIHDGYSCDNEGTEGVVWGERGQIGTVSCSGNSGTATFTRSGGDTNENWTVADHDLNTDVTAHVLIVTTAADTAKRIACGNFF